MQGHNEVYGRAQKGNKCCNKKGTHTHTRQDTKGNTLVYHKSVSTALNPLESKLTALLTCFHFGFLRCEDPGHEILFQDAVSVV